MAFDNELEFEQALINLLFEKGWEREVIKYPTEEDLIQNWANILFENNREIDKLNGIPLTRSEMEQIIKKIQQVNKKRKQKLPIDSQWGVFFGFNKGTNFAHRSFRRKCRAESERGAQRWYGAFPPSCFPCFL